MRLGQSWRCEWSVEIGYWYWDEEELVMRGLLTPRGIAVLAGGTAKPDDTIITVAAASESDTFGILSNPYLLDTACTTSFEVNLDLSQPNRFSYDQMTYASRRPPRWLLPPGPQHPHAPLPDTGTRPDRGRRDARQVPDLAGARVGADDGAM
jgi:hypothetical protein